MRQQRTGREARTALSALNLRLVLACFGLVSCALLSWAAAALDVPVGAGILAALALVAAIDAAAIQRRRRARRGRDYSLFE